MFKGLHYIIAYNIKRLAATQMSNENETVINYGTSIQWSTMQVFKKKKKIAKALHILIRKCFQNTLSEKAA